MFEIIYKQPIIISKTYSGRLFFSVIGIGMNEKLLKIINWKGRILSLDFCVKPLVSSATQKWLKPTWVLRGFE